MLLAAIHNRPFRMAAGGDHRFQFIHVDDVAQATLCALDCLEPTVRVFNITGGSQVALRDAAHIIRNLVPGADIDIGPGFWHLDRQGEWDISAAERELGYRPRVTPTPESPGTPTGCGSIRINARVGRRHRSFTGVTLDQRVLVEYETAVGPVRLLEVTAKHGLANPLPFPHPPDRSRRAWQRRATDRGHAWRTRL
jgi:hypothetical protein